MSLMQIPAAPGSSRGGPQIRVTPMVNYISALLFVLMLIAGALIAAAIFSAYPLIAGLFAVFWIFLDIVVCSSIRPAAFWTRKNRTPSIVTGTLSRVMTCCFGIFTARTRVSTIQI